MQFRDKQDDLLLGTNAKRVLDDVEQDENETIDGSTPTTSSQQKRPRGIAQQSRVVVKIELDEKELSKEDWMEIMAVGAEKTELHNEMSSLKSTVNQLAKDAGRTKDTLHELAQNSARTTRLLERLLFKLPPNYGLVPGSDIQKRIHRSMLREQEVETSEGFQRAEQEWEENERLANQDDE
jgi:hypothetical protein